MSSHSDAFRALRHRNFRLLWVGQLISMSGTMMQMAAVLWHVSLLVPPHLKGLSLGLVGLVRVVPIVTFSMVGGVTADTVDRRRLMLTAQSAMAVLAATLATFTFLGLKTVWPIYILTGLSAAAGAFDAPARQALLPTLVPREDLANALSLNLLLWHIASVIGPSLAGLAIATVGLKWVYAFNAVSFLAVIAGLLLMRGVAGRPKGTGAGISLAAALDGLKFVFSAPLLRSTMLLDFFATFFASATALLPIFAQDILKVGAHGYGLLYAAPSVGALLAAVALARWVDHIDRRGQWLVWVVGGFGLATVVFGVSKSFWLTFACLGVTGMTDTVSAVFRNLIRQLATPDHLRGRMTSVSQVFFMGGPQLGELEAGVVANLWGAVFSVVSGGIGCLVATGWIAARTPVLWNYRKDTAPHVAGGG